MTLAAPDETVSLPIQVPSRRSLEGDGGEKADVYETGVMERRFDHLADELSLELPPQPSGPNAVGINKFDPECDIVYREWTDAFGSLMVSKLQCSDLTEQVLKTLGVVERC